MNPRQIELASSAGLLILRVGIAGYMVTHGWGKFQMALAGNFEWADPIGLGPTLSLLLVTFAEFFCAILIILGLATRLAAVPLVFAMGVAAFVAHANDPWTMGAAAQLYMAGEAESWASKQPALMFGIAFLALIFTGPGKFSLDAIVMPKVLARFGSN
jgi:putative oxidoreductase